MLMEPLQLDPFPTFSPNGSGVIVTTKFGDLSYDAEEYSYYQNLFKMIDVQNKGFLKVDSPQFVMLLLRSDATWKTINKSIDIVLENAMTNTTSTTSGSSDSSLDNHHHQRIVKFYPWLMLCKLLAHSLEVGRDPTEKMFKTIHTTNMKRINPVLNFKLGQVIRKFSDGGFVFKRYSVKIIGWQVYGEDFQNQHVKFKINSTVNLVNRTHIKIDTTAIGNGNKSDNDKEQDVFCVERRYSEFESFANILHKNFKGIVTPPLPLKNIKYISQNDEVMNQRAIQLQMFLDYLSSHPDLKLSYELSVFLEAPSPGLKNFIDLYANVEGGQLVFHKRNGKPQNQIEGVVKLFQDGAQAVSNGAQVMVGPNNKAVELLSSIWGAVKKNIAVLTQPTPTYVIGVEDIRRFQETTKFLDTVVAVSKSLDSSQQHRLSYYQELHKLGQSLKSMSEIEDVPELITFLQRSSRSFAAIAQDQQDKLAKSMLSINVPVTFLGRYIENYKAAVSQHANAVDLLNEAHVREEAARKRVESLLEQQRALGLPAPPPVQQTPVLDDEDDDYEALSSSNLEINEFHQSHNEAQLELCRAETHCDEMKLEEQRLVGYVRKETRRLQFVERHQMLAYMVQFAKEQAANAEQTKMMWQDVFNSLDS